MSLHVGDWGSVFELTVIDSDTNAPLPLTGYSTYQMEFLRGESGAKLLVTATVVGNGTTGKMTYTFGQNDLNASGTWKVQAVLTAPNGHWRSDALAFDVKPNV